MKTVKFKKMLLIAMAIGYAVMFSCATNVLTGQTIKESRDLSSFNAVALAFSGDVYITQGSEQKVEIEADRSSLKFIESEVHGNTLVLKTKEGHWRDLGEVDVFITMPEISHLSVSGSGDILCEKTVNSDEIEFEVTGSGSINIHELVSKTVTSVITGSGNIVLAGPANQSSRLNATITGSGDFESENLCFTNAHINITGSGSARINVENDLETSITGSGSVHYKGNPRVNANATGSGRTRSLD